MAQLYLKLLLRTQHEVSFISTSEATKGQVTEQETAKVEVVEVSQTHLTLIFALAGDSPKLSCFEELFVVACRRSSLVERLEGGLHDGDSSTQLTLH